MKDIIRKELSEAQSLLENFFIDDNINKIASEANIFSKYIEGVGKEGDAILAISTSGNSPNILNAAKSAKKKGMKVVSLTGKDGGELSNLSDIEIRVPHLGYSDRIQEIHIKVIHILILLIEN